MKIGVLKENTESWNEIWDTLANHPINSSLDEPKIALNNELDFVWEYIYSVVKDNVIISEFRHKLHPLTKKPEKINLYHKLINLEDYYLKNYSF